MGKASKEESRSATSQAYDYIVDLAQRGELRPGDKIDRREVAARLGLSYSPVSEAMLQLEQEGILTSRPRKGTFVSHIDEDSANDQLVSRIAIECQAARMYCGERLLRHIERMTRLAEELEACERGGVAYAVKDTRFHRELVKLSGSASLLSLYDLVMRQGLLLAAFSKRSFSGGALSDHRDLIEALAKSSPDEAERLMRLAILDSKSLNASSGLRRERESALSSGVRDRLAGSMEAILAN